ISDTIEQNPGLISEEIAGDPVGFVQDERPAFWGGEGGRAPNNRLAEVGILCLLGDRYLIALVAVHGINGCTVVERLERGSGAETRRDLLRNQCGFRGYIGCLIRSRIIF